VDVAACVGGRSLEEYILPLMIQALSGKAKLGHTLRLIPNLSLLDVEESAVAKVLSSLTSLCELGLFQKMRLWELMGATLGFLYHPNIWIRQSASLHQDVTLTPQLASFARRRSGVSSFCKQTPSTQRRVVYLVPLPAAPTPVRNTGNRRSDFTNHHETPRLYHPTCKRMAIC
jgi:hypothetical protein